MDIKDICRINSSKIEFGNLEFGGKLACENINIVDKGKVIMGREEEFMEGEIFKIGRSFKFIGNCRKDMGKFG